MRLAEELTMATREGAVEWGRTLPFDIRDRYVSARVIATEIGGVWVYVFWYPSARVCFRSPAALHTGPVINDLMQAITEHFAATGRERYLTRAHWDVAETEEATT